MTPSCKGVHWPCRSPFTTYGTALTPSTGTLQISIMRSMAAISRLDATIGAMCLRRSQLERLCLYEALAGHTNMASRLMQGQEGRLNALAQSLVSVHGVDHETVVLQCWMTDLQPGRRLCPI